MKELAVVLDEDISREVEECLNIRGISTYRFRKGADDSELIRYAREMDKPLLTRDKDFRKENLPSHPGIITDSRIHLRSSRRVADAVEKIIKGINDSDIENHIWYISNYID